MSDHATPYGRPVDAAQLVVVQDLAPHGVLRVAINLGNPVLAQGTPAAPSGVTVDLAREIARRLGVPVELACFDAARRSFEAVRDGGAELCFLAVEPARAADIAFTAPYLLIDGVYAVPQDSALCTVDDVDRGGVRVGVKLGSAYDLYLTRTLRHAELVRGDEGVDVFRTQRLEVAAGIRAPLAGYVAAHPDLRLVDEPFMQIRQAVGVATARSPSTVRFLRSVVEELKESGFVHDALGRSGQTTATVAPPG